MVRRKKKDPERGEDEEALKRRKTTKKIQQDENHLWCVTDSAGGPSSSKASMMRSRGLVRQYRKGSRDPSSQPASVHFYQSVLLNVKRGEGLRSSLPRPLILRSNARNASAAIRNLLLSTVDLLQDGPNDRPPESDPERAWHEAEQRGMLGDPPACPRVLPRSLVPSGGEGSAGLGCS